ncbi:hypothetical protein [Paenibacillus sp. EZ-K15]|uniref:hypothetical protein n=1 Tax=Paenibacillus sp. EZ-K15 TaxID=2044275 RepID=UPI00192A6983|nr:hypothetical protein [Paenibacillus sp. EZ-K15]
MGSSEHKLRKDYIAVGLEGRIPTGTRTSREDENPIWGTPAHKLRRATSQSAEGRIPTGTRTSREDENPEWGTPDSRLETGEL